MADELTQPVVVRRSRLRRYTRRLAITLGVIYLIIAALLYFFQDPLIFPGSYLQGTEAARVEPGEGQRLLNLPLQGGGSIVALYSTALDGNGSPMADAASRPTILYFYGNGECIAYNVAGLERFRRAGFNVMVPDYPGYGLSPGRPSGTGVYETADACYAYVTGTIGTPPGRVAVVGRSLGGAPAVYLASREPVGALATLSAFRTLGEIAARTVHHLFPTSMVLRHSLDNLSRMKDVRCPTFVAHGTADDLIPFDTAAALVAATHARATLYPVERAMHNDLFTVGGTKMLDALEEFLHDAIPDDDRAQKKSPR